MPGEEGELSVRNIIRRDGSQFNHQYLTLAEQGDQLRRQVTCCMI
jgi:hypothetical protein